MSSALGFCDAPCRGGIAALQADALKERGPKPSTERNS